MRAFVTGATGFIGGRLASLLREEGWSVRGLLRPGRDPVRLAAIGVEPVAATLHDPAALGRACEGCDVVFHVAAALGADAVAPTVYRVNVDGTETLLRAAHEAGVRRFVFTSSVAVYGEEAPAGAGEDTPPRPSGPYGESKVMAEAACLAFSRATGLEVAILRPCFVYGPGDRAFTPAVTQILRGGWFPLVAGGLAPVDVAHVDDVARAHVLAAVEPAAAGRAYNVTDGVRRSLRALVEIGAQALGVRVRLIPIPAWAVGPAAALVRAAATLVRSPARDLITGDGFRVMITPHHFSIARARADLGFEPAVRLEDVAADVLRLYAGP